MSEFLPGGNKKVISVVFLCFQCFSVWLPININCDEYITWKLELKTQESDRCKICLTVTEVQREIINEFMTLYYPDAKICKILKDGLHFFYKHTLWIWTFLKIKSWIRYQFLNYWFFKFKNLNYSKKFQKIFNLYFSKSK